MHIDNHVGDENKEIIESMLYVEHEQVKVGDEDEELIESVLDVEHEPVDITEPEGERCL